MITLLVLLAGFALILIIRALLIINALPSFGFVLPIVAGATLALLRWLALACAFGYLALLILYPFFQ